ncbi:hypothetical protein SEUCBS139899_009309 [Sporothrix eucalyptigena]|uniref:Choline transport protein n=1 Tax=Sporothrix eucalyptigena TaxID=1812306 RepID=A0ABP0CQP8_9PEZI
MARLTADDVGLAKLGKKQDLKRRFGFWSLLGFATSELIIWEAVLSMLSLGFTNGGPAGLIYGYIISWISSMSVYLVISELVSMAPIAAGQYYWVFMLAPNGYREFASYLIGWLTSMAWISTIATDCIFGGTILQGLMILQDPSYAERATRWQGTLFSWAMIFSAILINTLIPGTQPKFEIGTIILHVAGFFTIVGVLWAYGTHSTTEFVFFTSVNEGGWPTQGLSYLVGYVGSVTLFVGADCSVHMAEEVDRPTRNVPTAIMTSLFFNGIIGLTMMLTVLYNIGDITSVLDSATGYPFLQVFYNALQSAPGAIALGAITLALTWSCAIGIVTTASRMSWSFARDRGTPFSNTLSKVDKRNKVPINAILIVGACSAVICLIYVGSSTAFNDVVSLNITGFYGSYFVPSAFLLYRRIKGEIKPYKSRSVSIDEDVVEEPEKVVESSGVVAGGNDSIGGISADGEISAPSATAEKTDANAKVDLSQAQTSASYADGTVAALEIIAEDHTWGWFHVPGLLGTINNIYACCYMIFVIFWSLWPSVYKPNASTMNYSVVVTSGVLIFALIWYFVRARKEYHGPIIDKEVAAIVMQTA